MVDIRLARVEDAPAIARIHVAVWQSAYRDLMQEELIDQVPVEAREEMWTDILTAYTESHPVIVAEDFGVGICGFGNAGPLRGEAMLGYSGEFKTLYLLPLYQRRGIGRQMLSHLAAHLIERGHHAAVAWVVATNPACGFFETMGGTLLAQREADEDGAELTDIAYGWTDLPALIRRGA
jgi:L-amino acid N-acyltransferase YncA